MIKSSTTSQRFHGITARMTVLTVFLSLFAMSSNVWAQLTYTETFNIATSTSALPLGWSQGKVGSGVDPDNYWDRVNVGGNPAAIPNGSHMMRYQARNINPGEASYLASKRFGMNGTAANAMPAAGALFSFNFWRDNTPSYINTPDSINVYVNTTPDLTGTPLLLTDTFNLANSIHRSNNLSPVTAVNGWVKYNYRVPVSYNSSASVYIIIVGYSVGGNNMFIDDFTMLSYPVPQSYGGVANAMVVGQNINNTGTSQVNQDIISCKLTMIGAFNPKVLTNMEFTTFGSTNPPADISNAKLYFTGGNSLFDISTAVPMGTYLNPWLTNYTFLTAPNANYSGLASFNGLEIGDNYFWILYDIPATGTPGNFVDAEWYGYTIVPTTYSQGNATPNGPNPFSASGARLIDIPYCIGTYTYGPSWANYNQNDYVREVSITGGTAPHITNTKNWITQPCTGNLSDGCDGGTYPGPTWPRDCPFQHHGPDYELFAETGHPGYTVGRSTTKSFTADGTTPYFFSVRAGTWYGSNYIAIFIDYNKDGDFFDAGEKITQSPSLAALAFHTGSFTVPTTATSGKTRLRVREVYADSNIDPCNYRTWGETEDYIITIIPDCAGYPGYTTWLGLTDDWNDPDNWCPAVAPLSANPLVNVRIPGGPSGAYTYVKPVIKAGVLAKAQKLRVEVNDTIFINATTASSLTVTDSLKIWTPTSAIIVNTTFLDTVQVYNTTLNRPTDNPLNTSERSRSISMFTQAELLGQGLVAGDNITNLLMHFQRKSNGNLYKNMNVRMYYTALPAFGVGYTAVPPTPVGVVTTVWSGDLNVSTFAGANSFGSIDFALATPFQWNGSANKLVVDICYDNTGFPSTGANDEIRFNQTASNRYYMNLKNYGTKIIASCIMSPRDVDTIPCTGTLGTNTVTISLANVGKVYVGQLVAPVVPGTVYLTGGTFVVAINPVTGVVTLSTNLVTGSPVNVPFIFVNTTYTNQAQYRPNVTFKTSRPYIKYPISVAGHWENNGTFTPAVSRVTMNGTVANQKISGVSNTTFYDLNIQNANHVMLYTDFTVTDSLYLVNGRLKLNNGKVTLTNQSPSALTNVVNFGDLQAETDLIANNVSPFGRLAWNMGSTVGMRTIPFISAAGARIPMNYNIDAGSHNVIISTYSTLQNNTNIPAPEVTNILGVNNAVGGGWGSGGWAMVDRYYFIDNTAGITPQADITFRYSAAEQAQSGNTNMKAQRWINTTDLWEFPFLPNNTGNSASNLVQLDNFSGFDASNWWTIVGDATPLPVSLLQFKAEQHKNKVKLLWSTASEINNSHFEIERTVNNTDFEFIGRAESKGPGTNVQDYYIWDNNPVEGTQYYYLRQFDYDGKMERFGPVSAKFSNDLFDIVTTTVSSSDQGLTVVFNYNSKEPYSYRIMDMTGRIIVAKDRNVAVEGLNVIDIDAILAKGAYTIILQNDSKVVSRKFFY